MVTYSFCAHPETARALIASLFRTKRTPGRGQYRSDSIFLGSKLYNFGMSWNFGPVSTGHHNVC